MEKGLFSLVIFCGRQGCSSKLFGGKCLVNPHFQWGDSRCSGMCSTRFVFLVCRSVTTKNLSRKHACFYAVVGSTRLRVQGHSRGGPPSPSAAGSRSGYRSAVPHSNDFPGCFQAFVHEPKSQANQASESHTVSGSRATHTRARCTRHTTSFMIYQ